MEGLVLSRQKKTQLSPQKILQQNRREHKGRRGGQLAEWYAWFNRVKSVIALILPEESTIFGSHQKRAESERFGKGR